MGLKHTAARQFVFGAADGRSGQSHDTEHACLKAGDSQVVQVVP